jgi:hypothetical protein
MTELKDWILEENLRPWLQILSSVVGYAFDDLDWDAVTAGIANTDAEGSRWYEHPLGSEAVSVRLAKEPGTALIMVTAKLSARDLDRATLAIQIAQSYLLISPP